MELLLGIFSAILLTCIFTGVSVIYAMFLGLAVFFGYGLIKKKTWKQMFIFSWQGMKTAKNVLLTFMLIGMMTAIWRASGSIAFIVYYASEICIPSLMLLAAFLLCSITSFLTGTSFGTAATMGVICMTMAKSMNISEILAGGAILAGVYFGDRCSPVSTSALLVSELTKTNLYENLKAMARTAIVPFTVSCATYWILGVQTHTGKAEENIHFLNYPPCVFSVITAAISCNQTLSIMLTNQLCGENNADNKKFALSLENSAVIVAPLIPWSIASEVPLAFIDTPTQSICTAIYLYLLPICYSIDSKKITELCRIYDS